MNTHAPKIFSDAQSAMPFVLAQGRNMESQIYQVRYKTFDYAPIVPVVTEGNQWAIGTTFLTLDVTGEAKFLSGSGTDMPFNSFTRDQKSHDFALLGSGWEWTMEEINQASLYGIPLSDTKAMTATQIIERKLYEIAMIGSTEKGWNGFTNYTGVSRADVAADGTGTVTFWSAKTPAQILRDMNTALWTVRLQSKQVEIADTIALPPEAMQYINSTYVGTEANSPTILERFRAGNPGVTVLEVNELATASNDGGGRMVAYRRSRDVLRFHLPMPRTPVPPRQKALMSFEAGIIARTGGTEVRLPGAMAYLDEITDVPA